MNEYLHEVDVLCEEVFSRLVKQLAEQENVTEQMKADERTPAVRRDRKEARFERMSSRRK